MEFDRLKAEFRDPTTPQARKPEIRRRAHEIYYRLPAGTMKPTDRVSKETQEPVLRLLYGDLEIARSNLEYARMWATLQKVQGRPVEAARWRRVAAGRALRLARIQADRSSVGVSQPQPRQQPRRQREHRSTGARSSRGSPESDDGPSDPPPAKPRPSAGVAAAASGNLEVLPRVIMALEAVQMAEYGMAEAVLRDLEDELRGEAA